MSSAYGKQYSIDELKKLNPPQEMEVSPPSCPTTEQWNALLNVLAAQYRLLKTQADTMERMRSTMEAMATQVEKLTTEAGETRRLLEQAGRKKERRLSLPQLDLPRPSLAWLWAIPILAALWILWYAWGAIWNNLLVPLIQLLQ